MSITIESELPKARKVIFPLRVLRWFQFHADWLIWNRIVKYSERMVMAPEGRNYRIMPVLEDGQNGMTPNRGLDACGLFTIFGFGILWGSELVKEGNHWISRPGVDGKAFVPSWRFGRIEIGMLKGLLPEDL